MKTLRLKFVDFEEKFIPNESKFIEVISKSYKIEYVDNPEYLFYSSHGYEHLKYDCIRIFYTGEQVAPDFDICDYAIGYDYIYFEDRYIRYPIYLLRNSYEKLSEKFSQHNIDTAELLARPFCSALISNKDGKTRRLEMLEKLQEYKKVDSAGKIFNNVGLTVHDKYSFISNYKFHLAFENSTYNGYTTEKIVDAFIEKTIPIYAGNRRIFEEFCEDSFIYVSDECDLDQLMNRIVEIDQDDEKYIKMLNSIKFSNNNKIAREKELESFLLNVFDQAYILAFRRPRSQRSERKILFKRIEGKLITLYMLQPVFLKKIVRMFIGSRL